MSKNKKAFYSVCCERQHKLLEDTLLNIIKGSGTQTYNELLYMHLTFLRKKKLITKEFRVEPTLKFANYIFSELYQKCKRLSLIEAQNELHHELSSKLKQDFQVYLMQQKFPKCLS